MKNCNVCSFYSNNSLDKQWWWRTNTKWSHREDGGRSSGYFKV